MSASTDQQARRNDAQTSDTPDEFSTVAHRAARLLASHPEQNWRLQVLAARMHLSASQLGRIFIRDLGISPMQYLARVRAHRLTQLLEETDLPIGVAMSQVGWHSRGHAARQFTIIIGASPSNYRRDAANGCSRSARSVDTEASRHDDGHR